jgi:aminopeptidase N
MPFSKYDQIFCPEFNMGAMENPGLVCINQLFLFQGQINNLSLITKRVLMIAHELSHMWFGNLGFIIIKNSYYEMVE